MFKNLLARFTTKKTTQTAAELTGWYEPRFPGKVAAGVLESTVTYFLDDAGSGMAYLHDGTYSDGWYVTAADLRMLADRIDAFTDADASDFHDVHTHP